MFFHCTSLQTAYRIFLKKSKFSARINQNRENSTLNARNVPKNRKNNAKS